MNPYIGLIEVLSQLKESSKHAIVNGETYSLNTLKEYLHVSREVEIKLKSIVKESSQIDKAQLVLVCGNVGDGKSHILSYLSDIISGNFKVHNDATESFNPDESFVETLDVLLENFKDSNNKENADKIILAINLGTLNNFLDEKGDEYSELRDFVREKGILDSDNLKEDNFDPDSKFQYINFTDYQLYELADAKTQSDVITNLFDKVFSEKKRNPIYKKYKLFKEEYQDTLCPIIFNYDFLSEKENRELVIGLMIKSIIKSKGIVSMRSILNFIYDIIIPTKFQVDTESDFKSLLKSTSFDTYFSNILPNYLFEHPDLSNIFRIISEEDPCNRRSEIVDDSVIKVINTSKIADFAKVEYSPFLDKGKLYSSLSEIQMNRVLISKTHIRLLYFSDSGKYGLDDKSYEKYIEYLYHINKGDKKEIKSLYQLVIEACKKWNGNPNENNSTIIEIGKKQKKYRVLQDFSPKPIIDNRRVEGDLLRRFYPQLKVNFEGNNRNLLSLHIDTGLFKLLSKVNQGYRPNKLDKNSYINFINFLNNLVEAESKIMTLKIDEVNIGKDIDFIFSTDAFGEYTFEKA